MATERQLRQQIRNLQNELQSIQQQNEQFHRQMNQQMESQLAQFQRQYEQQLQRIQNETDSAYAQRIREFQEDFTREQQRLYQQLSQQAADIAEKQQKKLDELEKCNQEMRELFQKMKRNAEENDAVQRNTALLLLEDVAQSRENVRTTPHEFFFHGDFEVIDGHARGIQQEIDTGMYQAAVADSNSIVMEFDLLRIRSEQALQEWLDAFRDYSRIVRGIWQRIQLLQNYRLQTLCGVYQMKDPELQFWSCGTYLPFCEKVSNALQLIESIERQGVEKFLKSQNSRNRKAIFVSCNEAKKWEDELTGITNCILSERTLSDERYVVAGEIKEMLKNIGYTVSMNCFRKNNRKVDPTDCYDLHMRLGNSTILKLLLIPVRENGLAVRNECLVTLRADGLCNQVAMQDVVQNNVTRIRSLGLPVNVIGMVSCTEQRLQSEETQRKKSPDPDAQIKYLTRKYH